MSIMLLWTGVCGAETLEEQAIEVVERMGGYLRASKPAVIATLAEEDRQILIRYHRSKLEALAKPAVSEKQRRFESPQHRTELLKLGDPDLVAQTLKTFRESNSPDREKAASELLQTGRPEMVALLAPGIMVDEPFVVAPMLGDVGGGIPFSYALANSLLVLVSESSAFPNDVRQWAKDNSKVSPQKTMPVIREWWKENGPSLKAGNFGAVKPGVDLRAADLAATRAIELRSQQYRDELIAKGKSPADLESWREWREKIYPSLLAASESKKADVQPTPPEPVAQPAPLAAVPGAPETRSHESEVYLWIGGGALVAMLAMLWVRLRGGSNVVRRASEK